MLVSCFIHNLVNAVFQQPAFSSCCQRKSHKGYGTIHSYSQCLGGCKGHHISDYASQVSALKQPCGGAVV